MFGFRRAVFDPACSLEWVWHCWFLDFRRYGNEARFSVGRRPFRVNSGHYTLRFGKGVCFK
jgi:hypothetical protein